MLSLFSTSSSNKLLYYFVFLSPVREGRECHNSRLQYKICENPSCPPGVPTFRDWQCQVLSVRPSYQKHVQQWQAVIDEGKKNPHCYS